MLGNKTNTKFLNSLNLRNAFKDSKKIKGKSIKHNQKLYSNNLIGINRRLEQDNLNLPINIR